MTVDWKKYEPQVRASRAAGLAYSKIARQIPGATRNSVAGICHRLGLTKAPSEKPKPRSPAAAKRAAA